MMKWDAEQVARLTELWDLGWSASMIASEMGATRNSIIGKAHRLNLPQREWGTNPKGFYLRTAKPGKPAPKPKKYADPKAKAAKAVRKPKPPKPVPVEFTAAAWEPLAWATPTTLEHVTGCRWPASDPFAPVGSVDLFCNCKQLDGKSYCAEHQARSVGNGTVSEQTAVRVARHYGNQELREAA